VRSRRKEERAGQSARRPTAAKTGRRESAATRGRHRAEAVYRHHGPLGPLLGHSGDSGTAKHPARPERFELPTFGSVDLAGDYSLHRTRRPTPTLSTDFYRVPIDRRVRTRTPFSDVGPGLVSSRSRVDPRRSLCVRPRTNAEIVRCRAPAGHARVRLAQPQRDCSPGHDLEVSAVRCPSHPCLGMADSQRAAGPAQVGPRGPSGDQPRALRP
jgi:hypothetical protein